LVFSLLDPSELDSTDLIVIQLLLFVDDRPGSQETIGKIRSYLANSNTALWFNHLQVIEIRQQPHLLEHFRLVATPALIKITPEPRHTLAGGNLVNQLQKWYPRWIQAIQEQEHPSQEFRQELQTSGYSAELLRLSDEIFKLQQEKTQLIDQLKFKDMVMEMLAHDLRSPLSAAFMAIETLEIAKSNSQMIKDLRVEQQMFQQARNQFRTINRMITDILQSSKNVDAQLFMHFNQLNLQSLCYEIIEQYKETTAQKTLLFDYDIPQNLPPVYADVNLIRQVITNLLDNAIKYTPKNGKVSLFVVHRTSQKMQVTIADNGPGIPEEKQELIFEGHFRLQRDQAQDGYGIGLAVCRKIITAHYGQIWVESEPGKGSCFHFTLPVYQ